MIRADRPQRRRLLFLLAILTAIVGVNLLTALPRPGIDVLLFQRESLDHLLRGTNPYTVEFQDPYSPSASALFYGPGVSVNGILQFGYPYMPLTLLSALPGHLLGDVRYASLGAMIGAALLIAFARENRTSSIGAALLLTTPAFPVMLLMGWVEAHVVVLVAATWYASCRAPRFLPYATGLLFASKQYTIVILPALMLLANGGSPPFSVVAFMTRAIIAGGVVTLPLVLWDVDAFLRSAVWLQIKQPFRRDALSFLTALFPAHLGQWIVLPFAMTAGVWVTILRLRAAVTFPLAIGLAFFVFFAFNKQAFLNYYYLVIGCLCCAIAAGDARETSVDEPATAVR